MEQIFEFDNLVIRLKEKCLSFGIYLHTSNQTYYKLIEQNSMDYPPNINMYGILLNGLNHLLDNSNANQYHQSIEIKFGNMDDEYFYMHIFDNRENERYDIGLRIVSFEEKKRNLQRKINKYKSELDNVQRLLSIQSTDDFIADRLRHLENDILKTKIKYQKELLVFNTSPSRKKKQKNGSKSITFSDEIDAMLGKIKQLEVN